MQDLLTTCWQEVVVNENVIIASITASFVVSTDNIGARLIDLVLTRSSGQWKCDSSIHHSILFYLNRQQTCRTYVSGVSEVSGVSVVSGVSWVSEVSAVSGFISSVSSFGSISSTNSISSINRSTLVSSTWQYSTVLDSTQQYSTVWTINFFL